MPHLRIGFVAYDWNKVEPWVHRLLTQINQHKELQISALIESEKKWKCPSPNWLYSLVYPLEKKIFARPMAAETEFLKALSATVPTIASNDDRQIRDLDLDVIFDIDASANGVGLTSLARHGRWFLSMREQADGVAGFDAVVGKAPVSVIELNRKASEKLDVETIATAAVNPKFILSHNALFMKEKSIVLIVRELSQLARIGTPNQVESPLSSAPPMPNSVDMLKYIGRLGRTLTERLLRKLKERVGLRPHMFFLKTGEGSILDFDSQGAETIIPRGNNYWADPFLWERDGEMYCFYENYNYSTKHGHLCVGRFDPDGFKELGDVLKLDYHLSFPFLFEHGDDLYMMPETNLAQRIEVWRCIDFPLKWELNSTAMEGVNTADSMVLTHQGKCWLFTNISNDVFGDNCSELYIFEIDGPDLERIVPHKANPVVMDSRTARNAGRIHQIGDKLYRPAQDNAYGQYGYGLNIMQIEELSLETYRETNIRKIIPELAAGIAGGHHFDAIGSRYIVDVLKESGGRPD